MMPTRLSDKWEQLSPEIRKRWQALTDDDMASVGGQPASLVEAIRRRYHPGRSAITIEAKILDWLNGRLDEMGRGE